MNTELIETIGIVAGSAGILLSLVMMFVQHRKKENGDRKRYVRSKAENSVRQTYTFTLPSRHKVSH